MTTVATVEKVCRLCGDAQPLSEFSPKPSNRDGLETYCKACARQKAKDERQQRIDDRGIDEVRRQERERLARWRKRTGNENGREYQRQRTEAVQRLIELHRSEFDHLFLLARRGELNEVAS